MPPGASEAGGRRMRASTHLQRPDIFPKNSPNATIGSRPSPTVF
jgi:hypothetical protein